MIVDPIKNQNRASVLAAEQTRRTILHFQAEIARLEKLEAHLLEIAGEPESDPETKRMAQRLAPENLQPGAVASGSVAVN